MPQINFDLGNVNSLQTILVALGVTLIALAGHWGRRQIDISIENPTLAKQRNLQALKAIQGLIRFYMYVIMPTIFSALLVYVGAKLVASNDVVYATGTLTLAFSLAVASFGYLLKDIKEVTFALGRAGIAIGILIIFVADISRSKPSLPMLVFGFLGLGFFLTSGVVFNLDQKSKAIRTFAAIGGIIMLFGVYASFIWLIVDGLGHIVQDELTGFLQVFAGLTMGLVFSTWLVQSFKGTFQPE